MLIIWLLLSVVLGTGLFIVAVLLKGGMKIGQMFNSKTMCDTCKNDYETCKAAYQLRLKYNGKKVPVKQCTAHIEIGKVKE